MLICMLSTLDGGLLLSILGVCMLPRLLDRRETGCYCWSAANGAAEVLECRVRRLDRYEAGCCYAGVLTLSKEVVLGAGLLLDIAIKAAGVGVLREGCCCGFAARYWYAAFSIEAAGMAVNLVALWLSEVNH